MKTENIGEIICQNRQQKNDAGRICLPFGGYPAGGQ